MSEHPSSFDTQEEPDMHEVAKHVEGALVDMREELSIRNVGRDAVVVDTGRVFPDGTRVYVRVWSLPNRPSMLVVSDGGATYARVGENELATPDLALSVRYDLLKNLPVQDIGGQVVVYTKANGLAESIGMVADACLFLDTAVLAAVHLRPRPRVV